MEIRANRALVETLYRDLARRPLMEILANRALIEIARRPRV